MTKREFLNEVIATVDNTELVEFAAAELGKMDGRNAARKAKPSKKAVENEPIKAEIVKVLTDEPKTATEVATAVGISVQKASALLRQIDCTVTDIKVKGKGTQKGYSL